jgi:peptide/nickel transport system permease protein
MKRFLARQAVRLVVGVSGAVAVATVVSALGEPHGPGLLQFGKALGSRLLHFTQLDLGQSAISGLSVLQELAIRLPPTLLLVLMGAGVAVAAGLPLGLLFVVGPARRVAAPLVQIVTATPVFCAGLALAYGAVHLLHWPVGVNMAPDAAVAPDHLLKLTALPVLTVGLAGAAAVQLALRRAAAHTSGEAFRTGLKRMGLGTFDIERLYVVPQVLAGLVSSAGEIMLALLSAAVVAEWVFHRPGAADLFVKSVALADWNMAAMILFVFAVLTFVADFLGRVIGFALANEGQR